MWTETGSSPRDIHEDCESTRGYSVAKIRRMYWEAGWEVLKGPSRIWNSRPNLLEPVAERLSDRSKTVAYSSKY